MVELIKFRKQVPLIIIMILTIILVFQNKKKTKLISTSTTIQSILLLLSKQGQMGYYASVSLSHKQTVDAPPINTV